MRTRPWIPLLIGALAALSAQAANAAEPPGGPQTAPPPGAPVVGPVDRLADALGELGRGEGADVYGGLRVDPQAGVVTLYATDAARGRALAAAARKQVGGRAAVRLRPARFTRSELVAEVDRLRAASDAWARSGADVRQISVRPDAGGIVVHATDPARAAAVAARPGARADAAIPLTFEPAGRGADLSRYADVPPFAGGAAIGRGGTAFCTSAFAIRRAGQNLLVTAEHCYLWGSLDVYTGGGASYIGRVSIFNDLNDAAGIPTNAWSGVWTSDSSWTHYGGNAWSYAGQNVCQSGFRIGYNCALRTTVDYTTWRGANGIWHGGVEACSTNGYAAAYEGDSGGPVYVWYSNGYVQSRGIVSHGRNTDSDASWECMQFTETNRLLGAWGAYLLTR